MAVIGSYNGSSSILAFPSKPAPRQIELGMNDTNAIGRSPFTGQTQVQSWPGADMWDASIALPKLTAEDAAVWSAFLAETRGTLNVFFLSDPTYKGPRGTLKGSPVVSGVNNAMATVLNTRGWTASLYRLLLPGDYLQLGNRLHRVLDQVNSDGSGNATISIWPTLREATADGDAINFNNPKGLFRFVSNRRSVLTDETRLSGVTLKAIEAR
jgi:hypothetical protein